MSTTKTAPDLQVVTTKHANAVRLEEGFAAFARGDLDFIRDSMAPGCTWTNGGSSVLGGTYSGWDEIVGMFGKLLETTQGTYTMNVLSVFGDDARCVAIYDATSTIAGQTRTMRFAMIEEMTPDGKVAEVTSLAYDQDAADAHMAGRSS